MNENNSILSTEDVLEWLNEIIKDPDEWRICYRRSEAKELAEKAKELIVMEENEAKVICKIIFEVPYYFCDNCKAMLNMYGKIANYCSECGKKMKWG